MGLSKRGPKVWSKGMRRRQNDRLDYELAARERDGFSSGPLPLVHVTASHPAHEIIRDGKLVTSRCDVFDAQLVYFFVLRPAYCKKIGREKSHQLTRFPVAFILRPEAVSSPHHVYPFDSGGGASGAFHHAADPYVHLEDYALDPRGDAAERFIGWAFGDLDAYYAGRLHPDLEASITPDQWAAVGYASIARLGVAGHRDHDLRASTLEVASSQNVDLATNVRLLIVPKQLLEGTGSFLDDIAPLVRGGAAVEPYDWQPNRAPNEYQRDLIRIARQWYSTQKIMA